MCQPQILLSRGARIQQLHHHAVRPLACQAGRHIPQRPIIKTLIDRGAHIQQLHHVVHQLPTGRALH